MAYISDDWRGNIAHRLVVQRELTGGSEGVERIFGALSKRSGRGGLPKTTALGRENPAPFAPRIRTSLPWTALTMKPILT